MKTYLISIISKHLIPNYLFIKEWKDRYDDMIFITTEEMEALGITLRLERALNLVEYSVRRITVSEENLNDLHEKLKEELCSKENQYIVNITGGTKIMSLGCHYFFSRFNSSFYYIPIGRNKINDVGSSADIPILYRMNLWEYLTLYGLTAKHEVALVYPPEHTKRLFLRFKQSGFNRYKIPQLREAQNLPDEKDKRYYGGIWFEEYCFQRMKEELVLSDESIWQGIKLFRGNSGIVNDNEIDVMFVRDNQLYVCECKMSLSKPQEKAHNVLEQYMYKLAAISKDFGLIVKPYIMTIHRGVFSDERGKSIKKRMDILGIKGFFDSRDFKEEMPWKEL